MNDGPVAIAFGASLVAIGWLFPDRGFRGRAAGVWRKPPVIAQRLLRRGKGELLVSLVVAQMWGWALILTGAAVLIGLVPGGRPSIGAVAIVSIVGLVCGGLTVLLVALSDWLNLGGTRKR